MGNKITNSEILKRSKKILLKSIEEVHKGENWFQENKDSYSDWLSEEDVITIGTSNIEDYQYKDPFNCHHYTIDWYYDNLLPIIISQLKIPYNKKDFVKLEKNNLYCLIPKQVQEFDVYHPKYSVDEKYCWVYYLDTDDFKHEETSQTMFMCDTIAKGNFYPTHDDSFHRIFKYCHFPVKIFNKTCENDKVLLLIANSHSIPFISILTKYYKKVIVIDNRLIKFTYDIMFDNEDYFTDILILASYDTNKNSLLKVVEND